MLRLESLQTLTIRFTDNPRSKFNNIFSIFSRERDILEQTSVKSVRASHSTESILRDTSPPPKPPLPNRSTDPPPLPPKRSSHKQTYLLNDSDCISDASFLACGLDR